MAFAKLGFHEPSFEPRSSIPKSEFFRKQKPSETGFPNMSSKHSLNVIYKQTNVSHHHKHHFINQLFHKLILSKERTSVWIRIQIVPKQLHWIPTAGAETAQVSRTQPLLPHNSAPFPRRRAFCFISWEQTFPFEVQPFGHIPVCSHHLTSFSSLPIEDRSRVSLCC